MTEKDKYAPVDGTGSSMSKQVNKNLGAILRPMTCLMNWPGRSRREEREREREREKQSCSLTLKIEFRRVICQFSLDRTDPYLLCQRT
jgi:hypothetical protein